MVSRIILLSGTALPRSFPKASAKVVQFSNTTNLFEDFFEKSREKIKHTTIICANNLFSGLNPIKKLSKSYTDFNKAFKTKNKIGDSLHG